MAPEKKILGDHKREKNKFIPPVIHMLGGFKETSWIKYGLPELFWISLLQHVHGLKVGSNAALEFTELCLKECADPKPLLVSTTSFNSLASESKTRISSLLKDTKLYRQLSSALGGLLAYYPECPLSFLMTAEATEEYRNAEELLLIKNALSPLFYKLEKEPVFTQATFYYIGSIQGKFHVASHLSLAHFPEIEKYPTTELSEQIASGVRAMASMVLGGMVEEESGKIWADYFWNQGLKIEHCISEEL